MLVHEASCVWTCFALGQLLGGVAKPCAKHVFSPASTATLFSSVAVRVYPPSGSARAFLLPHTRGGTWHRQACSLSPSCCFPGPVYGNVVCLQ